MRIIAGSKRSLPLCTPQGTDTRPTPDKLKETLFNMLQTRVPGCIFLDLFAGSGQIGLEALSRDADYAVFVENARKAAKCIEKNIAFTNLNDRAELLVKDVFSALSLLEGRYCFDIIFMDPPYNKGVEMQVLSSLRDHTLLKEDGLIVVEASLNTDFSPAEEMGYRIERYKKYKTNAHVFLRRK